MQKITVLVAAVVTTGILLTACGGPPTGPLHSDSSCSLWVNDAGSAHHYVDEYLGRSSQDSPFTQMGNVLLEEQIHTVKEDV